MKPIALLLAVLLITFFSDNAFATQAQPVPVPEEQSLTPQVEIAGVGAGTLYGNRLKSGINLSDSALVISAAQRLSDGAAIGSTGLGWLTLDDTNRGLQTQLFLHQGFLDYQSERIEFLIGRSDNPTAHVVDFPTIRGDDLVTLTNPMNPFSDGDNAEEHRYSNVASVTFNQKLKYFENFHVQHLIDSAGIGSDTGINSAGVSFEFLNTPGMEPFQQFTSFGLGYEHFILDSGGRSGLHQLFAGGVYNLNTSVTHRWDLRFQEILTFGSGLTTLSTATDSFQADSNSIAVAIRYLNSPFGSPGYQLSLTGAYKTYAKVAAAKSIGGILTGVKRLGQGFDLVTQYQGQWRDVNLARAQTNGVRYDHTFEIGFIFNFSATINQHLAPRRSILNQQFQYIPN